MPFISLSDEVAKKSFTQVENKFITKYLTVLDPLAVKVYLYALYVSQVGALSYTLFDFAASLNITEDDVKSCFEHLEEFELISIISSSPFEVKILDCENAYGTPKKFKPEKYGDFTKSVQNVLSGRMISTNEFREYFILLEEYGFEQNALIMIINYCVNLKGADIRFQYIKKVAKSFAEEGVTTAKKVDEKLAAYNSSTPALIKLFTAAGIKKQPDIDDDKLYKKWTQELGFDDEAVVCAAKLFKAKSCEKIDEALEELYKNRKFDVKEIEDYCKTKNSLYLLARDVAKNLGVYVQTATPYVENYISVWCDCGYSFDCLKKLANYCFKNGKNSFADMDEFVKKLYADGLVTDDSVEEFIKKTETDDKFIKSILTACGLTRKIIPWDRESLERWRSWNFSDDMLFEAAKLSAGRANPTAYMNAILSAWKNDGIFSADRIPATTAAAKNGGTTSDARAEVERHYYDLRHAAEVRAEKAYEKANADETYGALRRELNELNIQLAFAEIRDQKQAAEISKRIAKTEKQMDSRLKELGMNKEDFVPKYSCPKCNDTGYDEFGNPCDCMKKFVAELK